MKKTKTGKTDIQPGVINRFSRFAVSAVRTKEKTENTREHSTAPQTKKEPKTSHNKRQK